MAYPPPPHPMASQPPRSMTSLLAGQPSSLLTTGVGGGCMHACFVNINASFPFFCTARLQSAHTRRHTHTHAHTPWHWRRKRRPRPPSFLDSLHWHGATVHAGCPSPSPLFNRRDLLRGSRRGSCRAVLGTWKTARDDRAKAHGFGPVGGAGSGQAHASSCP